MIRYLLPKEGKFYKANLHCHTNLSDGSLSPEEIKALYRRHGYAAVAFTDHDVFITHNDLTDGDFVALNGFEIEVDPVDRSHPMTMKTAHVCAIAEDPAIEKTPVWHRSRYFRIGNTAETKKYVKFDENEPDYVRVYSHEGVSEIMRRCREKNFFVTYNHPAWSLEDWGDYSGYKGMNAVEIYNHASVQSGYPCYEPKVYDDLLHLGNRIGAVYADDNHNACPDGVPECDSCGGFVQIKAERLDYKSLTAALARGDYYASNGPSIEALWFDSDGNTLHVKTSDAVRIGLVYGILKGDVCNAEIGKTVNEAVFHVDPGDKWWRINVLDAAGKTADSRAYFEDEIFG